MEINVFAITDTKLLMEPDAYVWTQLMDEYFVGVKGILFVFWCFNT